MVDPHLDKAMNEIDAAMFSGDAYAPGNPDVEQHRNLLEFYMARWQRYFEACDEEKEKQNNEAF